MRRALRTGLAVSLLAGCIVPGEGSLARFEFTESHMGTPCRVVFYAAGPGEAERARRAAFAELAAVDERMSDYREDSEISRLSRRSGVGPVPVSEPLFEVLSAARKFSELSGGAFDVTVGPLVELWRKARREGRLPPPEAVREALERTGWTKLVLDPAARTVCLERAGMKLDVGGIAKGYACDRALAALARLGIRRAMVDTGGGMALGDPPPDRTGWRIQVADQSSKVLVLARRGVATSGDWERYVEIDGVRYSHIVDPATGVGLTNRILVTVVAPDGMSADALSTALSVLGPERGLRLAEDLPGVEAWMRWRENGAIRTAQTSGFAALLEP
ncbi:MAG TPA: FAD:protein FMN transferase [Planctomycetota bacterium]|nr:FAD:protein FMN transferase [Planctomycetota bacterium]